MTPAPVILDRPTPKDALFNDRPARVDVQREKPEHRIMLVLKAQGYSNAEIAEVAGYSRVMVNTIMRQPWARARLLDMINEKGGDAIQKVLSGEILNSVDTLVEVRDDVNAGHQARLSAANSILDRALGRPTQKVESVNTNISLDVNELDREIAKVEAECATLFGRAPTASPSSASFPANSPARPPAADVLPSLLPGQLGDKRHGSV